MGDREQCLARGQDQRFPSPHRPIAHKGESQLPVPRLWKAPLLLRPDPACRTPHPARTRRTPTPPCQPRTAFDPAQWEPVTRPPTTPTRRAHHTLAFLAGAYLVLLAYATLTPADTAQTVTGVVDVIAASFAAALGADPDATYAVAESAANVALFTPLGMLVAAPRASAPAIALVAATSLGAATSLAIELAQRGIDGRVSTMADVAANTAGAILGAALVTAALSVRARRPRVTTARTP